METLIARLADANIKVAAVIDEAFDPPTPAMLGTGLNEFWTEVEANSDALEQLKGAKIPCADRASFERDGLSSLWERRDALEKPLSELATALFSGQLEKLKDPETVAQHLEALKLKSVHRIGARGNIPAGTQLVFLDYDLEGIPLPARKLRRSVVLARNYAARESKAPFLVLFSNAPKLAVLAKRFRKTTGYLGGTFAFLAKEDAREKSAFCLYVSGFGLGHPVLHLTQQFFRALQTRLKDVARTFDNEVMQLDVQDYAFIQRLALQDDGAPLGEYLLDMFGMVLRYELQSGEDVQKARHQLDGLNFERHLPFTGQPSAPVRKMYRALLTEPGIGKAEPHALAGDGKCKDADGKDHPFPPLLMLGDIFAAPGGREVYVVVSPACELQYSPKNEGRQPKLDMTVHLLRGSLVLPRTGIGKGIGKRMELLELENQVWRVWWHPEQVQSVALGKFAAWQAEHKFERVARLSLPFAVSLQQYWTAQLGRVGLPVNLPFFNDCNFQLYRPKAGNGWQKSGKLIRREAILARHPRDREEPIHFTFTRSGRDYLRNQLSASATALTESFPGRSKAAKHLLDDWAFWTDLVEVPQPCQMRDDWVDKKKEAIVFKWQSPPSKKEFGALQKAAIVVVFKETGVAA